LYLNKKLIGTQNVDSNYTAKFLVAYEPGELKAVVMDGKKEGESVSLFSFGSPSALRVTCDKTHLKADGQDLAFITVEVVDKDGNIVPLSDQKVSIVPSTSTYSQIISGNASPSDMQSFRSSSPRFFEGRIQTIVRTSSIPEQFTLTFTTANLPPHVLTFVVK